MGSGFIRSAATAAAWIAAAAICACGGEHQGPGEITGAELAGSGVSNISGAAGVNIYYQPALPGNAYLGGFVYDFGVSGQLLPIQPPVPVPAVPGWATAALGLLLVSLGGAAIRAGRVGAGGALG